MFGGDFEYKYCPILYMGPSEMTALKELPEKDKNKILPIFPIKSWATCKKLSDSINKIESVIGNDRKWIADIDYEDILIRNPEKCRDVHYEIEKLMDSSNGYENWCDFIRAHPQAIPCVQINDASQFVKQLKCLSNLKRGVVVIIRKTDIESGRLELILPLLKEVDDLFFMVDFGQISRDEFEHSENVLTYLKLVEEQLPKALLSLSSSSFPENFGGYYKGEKSIYERALFDKLKNQFKRLIYSDRGGARAIKMSGGSGTPPPRIDYACKNEWKFIRMEPGKDSSHKSDEDVRKERKMLYTTIAKNMMLEPYWEKDLQLWSNYIIELTSKGDEFGINSPQKSTAVRINKHIHTQLYYDHIEDLNDTDDEWVD